MNFTFINLTTALPVDCELKEYFESKMSKEFRCALEQPNRFTDPFLNHTPIFFVSKNDEDLEREKQLSDYKPDEQKDENPNFPEMDMFGVYFSFFSDYRQPIIKISPEKIWKSYDESFKNTHSEAKFFKCLVSSVIFHEISHFIMDFSDRGISTKPRAPWKWALKHSKKATEFLKSTTNFGNYEKLDYSFKFVEESLANAIMLKQNWDDSEYAFLLNFTKGQPRGYRHSWKWKGSLQQTIETAHSFGELKHLRLMVEDSRDSRIQDLQRELEDENIIGIKKRMF